MDFLFGRKKTAVASEPIEQYMTTGFEYDCSHRRTGIALIINNVYFNEAATRDGSDNDADTLHKILNRRGFDVRRFDSLETSELTKALRSVQKEDHSDSDCFLLAILSHGDEVYFRHQDRHGVGVKEDAILTKDGRVLIKDILLYFGDTYCRSLKGKPRLIFIQACRGQKLDDGTKVLVTKDSDEDAVDAPGGVKYITRPVPIFKDFLVVHASPPGCYSFRRPKEGSWFVLALNEILSSSFSHIEVNILIRRVMAKVALEYESSTDSPVTDKKKQIPCSTSMLTKRFFLRDKAKETTV